MTYSPEEKKVKKVEKKSEEKLKGEALFGVSRFVVDEIRGASQIHFPTEKNYNSK